MAELQPGYGVERYTVQQKLGQGGMAVVFRVRHNDLDTEHALKVLTITNPGIQERLLQEGKVQASLRHPNVVAVTDVLTVGGAPGLLMEYVHGQSLEDWIDTLTEPALHEAEALFRDVVAGVAKAHEQELIHRDLKPANVMLQPNGKARDIVAKVADFGLARFISDEMEAGGKKRTRTGVAMGTPAYMSPEQIRDAKNVDARADIFSLGCMLYELVCGARQAFLGDDILTLFQNITAGVYVPPEQVRPDLPLRIVYAIKGALQPDRDRRIHSCEELLAVLDGKQVPLALQTKSTAEFGTFDPDAMDEALAEEADTDPGVLEPFDFERKPFSDAAMAAATKGDGSLEVVAPLPADEQPSLADTFGFMASLGPGSGIGFQSQPTLASQQTRIVPSESSLGETQLMQPTSQTADQKTLVPPEEVKPRRSAVPYVLGGSVVALLALALVVSGAFGPSTEPDVRLPERDRVAVDQAQVGTQKKAKTRRGKASKNTAGTLDDPNIEKVMIPIGATEGSGEGEGMTEADIDIIGPGEKPKQKAKVNIHLGDVTVGGEGEGTADDPGATNVVMQVSDEDLASLDEGKLPPGWSVVAFQGDADKAWLESKELKPMEFDANGRVPVAKGTYRVMAQFPGVEPVHAMDLKVPAARAIFVHCDSMLLKCSKAVDKVLEE